MKLKKQNSCLTPFEKALISLIQLNGDIQSKELASIFKVHSVTIQKSIKDLEKRRIITYKPIIDFFRLGYIEYTLFLKISPKSAPYKKIIQFL